MVLFNEFIFLELEEMILVEGLKGLSRPTRGLPRGFFENGILEEISVLNKFIANQTNPSLQTMGISIEKQLKLTESLKGIKNKKNTCPCNCL